jgi:hypothetical protein
LNETTTILPKKMKARGKAAASKGGSSGKTGAAGRVRGTGVAGAESKRKRGASSGKPGAAASSSSSSSGRGHSGHSGKSGKRRVRQKQAVAVGGGGGRAPRKKRDPFALATPAEHFRNLRHARPAPTDAEDAWFKQEHPSLLKTMAAAVEADNARSAQNAAGKGDGPKKRRDSGSGESVRGRGGTGDGRRSRGGDNNSSRSSSSTSAATATTTTTSSSSSSSNRGGASGRGKSKTKTKAKVNSKMKAGAGVKKAGAGGLTSVASKRGTRKKPSQTSAEAELKKKLALHNKSLLAKKRKVKYEPRKHSIKDVRSWEQRHQRMWSELTVEERIVANEDITTARRAAAAEGRVS